MKHLSLLLLLFCFFAVGGRAATVSGTVTNTYSSSPAAGLKVYLVDSPMSGGAVLYKDSAITSSTGGYSITIPSSVTTGTMYVYANTCGYYWRSGYSSYSGSSLTLNLSINCSGYLVQDTVRNSSTGAGIYGQKVYILDSTATTYFKDSAYTDRNGVAYFGIPSAISSGTFTVYTYSCGWQTQAFTYAGSNMAAPALAVCAINTIVSGTVTNTTTGNAVSNQRIIITDSSATRILIQDSVYTNASGSYSMPIPLYLSSGTMIAATQACGSRIASTSAFSGSSLTLNLSVCASSNATISGIVRDIYTSTPVSGQKIYLTDSSSSGTVIYLDSTLSNSSGVYSFTVSPSIITGYFMVCSYSCGAKNYANPYYLYYNGYSLTANIAVCSPGTAAITGTVTNASTSAVVPNHKVYFVDSSATGIVWGDSTLTNASGSYTFYIPGVITSGKFEVSTASCGSKTIYKTTYTGGNLTANFAICSTSTAIVSGYVYATSSGLPVSGRKVYLLDSTNATSAVYRDSTVSNSSGFYSFNIPASISSGTFRIGAQSCGTPQTIVRPYSGYSISESFYVGPNTSAMVYGYASYYLGSPAYNQKIYIIDSTGTYFSKDSVYTDYAGYYSYPLPATAPVGSTLRIYTVSCGSISSTYAYYSGTCVYESLFICPGSFGYALYGNVTLGGAPNNGPTMLYLIYKTYDPVLMDTTLTAIDSFTTIGTTGTYNRSYTSGLFSAYSHTGQLLLKAALLPSHSAYASYLPSYFDSSLTWSGAHHIDSADFTNRHITNLNMKAGVNPGGAGFIGGSVLLGANRSAGVGDPLDGRILLLTTATGDAVAYTYSDASGKFSFSNLAFGSYLIFGDAWDKTNPPLSVTISGNSPAVRNIIFEENSNSFAGRFDNVGVNGISPLQAIRMYPNPAKDYVALEGLSRIKGDKTAVLRDITGITVSKTEITGSNAARLDTHRLPAGMYLLELQTQEGTANYRFVKE